MSSVIPPSLRPWLEISVLLAEEAAAQARRLPGVLRPRRHGVFVTRRPGVESPMWNVLAALLREELKPLGSKVRLARYLGVPKQRLHDFLKGKSRLPDAELTLQMLHWLAQKRAGRDLSL